MKKNEAKELWALVREAQREAQKEMQEIRKEAKETDRRMKETDQQIKETSREIKETSRQMKETDRRLGKFVNSFGDFVESIAAPSIPKVMQKQGITVMNMHRDSLSRRNGSSMEIDVLCLAKRKDGQEVVLITEIKSKVTPEDIRELLKEIQTFTRFFPEYGKRPKIGIIAGVTVTDDVARHAEKLGLYVMGPSGETLRLLNKKGFKPKIW